MVNNLYNVSFPGLGINLTINPIALIIGSVKIRWYGVILAIGFLLGFIYVYLRAKDFNLSREKLTDVIIIGTIFGILGARIYYVIFYPDNFYKLNPWKVFTFYEGGMAIYGGIIGGMLGGIITAKIKKVEILPALDLVSFGLLIGQAIGRWGNFFNQEAFGSETRLPWGMVSEATKNIIVHPCFLYESLWCMMGFLTLHILSINKRLKNGQYFAFYILWYGVGRVFIEGLRSDSLIFINTKVSQLVSVILIFASLAIYNLLKLK